MSQKKQKKIKISNTNREPYLNHSTLISSNYDNVSGIKIIEYMKDIHVSNISNEFINYFNAFITETGTQDLSNFFDIEIKNISINLTKLLDNVNDNFATDNLLNFFEKNIYEESFIKINEKYKNNYNFILLSETPINIKIKNIQDETFNINKNYKSTLQSFILLDDNNKKYLINDLYIDINLNNPFITLNTNDNMTTFFLNNYNFEINPIKENNENILFSSIDNNLNINIDKFIPKETIDKLNISDTLINLELNIDTDFKKFNNFLNNTIMNTNYSLEDKTKEFLLNELRKSCNCIINVYQLVYNENKIASGLGDFIRGSYFLIDFCKKYNFKYFIDISNHPIKNFLKKYNKIKLTEKIKNIYKKINKFEQDNFNPVISRSNNFITNYSNEEIYFNFLEYLTNKEKYDKKIFIYTITFPNEGSINNYKKIMRDILEPTNKMELLINIKLKILDLKSYSYEIIHIRCGDEYLSNKIINNNSINIQFILSDFDKLNPNKKYLLISDNNFIKTFIKKKYNFINILYHDIVHTGENSEIMLKKLENTMLDFYLISKSKNVMSYSVYEHGSGFSKWCAFTYDIPYYCKYFGK
jgi:hypothetical protein